MKWFALVILLGLPAQGAAAQSEPLLRFDRPSFATSGKETLPMMTIDEAVLPVDRFQRTPLPLSVWVEERGCLAALGVNVDSIGTPPEVLVIPAVRTIRVHDMTVDSLNYAEDSTYMGETWAPPTVAYALVRSNLILVTAEYRLNPYVLRHEALHFMVWRLQRVLGHPKEFFEPCDVHYDPRLPGKRYTPNNDWR